MAIKYAFGISYDGSRYSGWQRQMHTSSTVQEKLEDAISKIANESLGVHCAGRTDCGVHATGQVIHAETNAIRSDRSWVRGINTLLPDDISVQWVKQVDNDFHARYKALRRSYRYIIDNYRHARGALNRTCSSWVYHPLNEKHMQLAGDRLLGTHDFTSFRASACQAKTPVKTIYRLDVRRCGDFVILEIEADAFLHRMVRNIAGVLIMIGRQEADISWCEELLNAHDRKQGGITAKPEGLYLTGVKYPGKYNLPCDPSRPLIL